MATLVARPLRMRTDDYFFTGMSLLILGTVFLGFAHTYYLAGTVHARLPNILVHIHGAIFSCWILLLIAQTTLVSVGKDVYKRQGITLIFVREEARRQPAGEEARCKPKGHQQDNQDDGFLEQYSTPMDISLGGFLEHAIKPIKESP